MERHIGLWSKESDDSPAVAELIIEGNHIEFYRRDHGEIFPCAFVGSDNNHIYYKVFTNGTYAYGKHRTLENAVSYKPIYVLCQNFKYEKGLKIEGITACSFIIPELMDWIGGRTVEWGATKNQELIAVELKLQEIILKKEKPRIEIYFEASSSLFDESVDNRTTSIIKNQPRIRISYEEPSNVSRVHNDIKGIMQFFGLMIGHVSDAIDIRLDIQGQSLKSWLYVNEDFSYNLKTMSVLDRTRTKLSKVQENIQFYFENWYNFYNDNKFELIRRMYFLANTKKDIYVEDLLILYVRILEGYHLRITDEENITSNIEKDIKEMIFTDLGRKLFTPIFEKVQWKFNSKHAKKVASWIASGFLERVDLAERIKQLDEQYFSIIAKNAENIIKLENKNNTFSDEYDKQEIILKFYRSIVSTRNYYSHYKARKENVLNFNQICDTINVLKALIIMIMFSHMGMTKEQIRKIIIWDSELHFQTKCLRYEGETPDDK
ncbi:MAG: hypothetical protein PWQ70_3015 [Clostridiales bacterium]|nr:hypothetical protein [Clostridiales bacterium]